MGAKNASFLSNRFTYYGFKRYYVNILTFPLFHFHVLLQQRHSLRRGGGKYLFRYGNYLIERELKNMP